MIEEMDNRARASDAARREAASHVSVAGLSPSQALAAVFGTIPQPQGPKNYDRPRDQHDHKPHQLGLRLGELRDGIAPAAEPAAPAPAPIEPLDGAPPARLAELLQALEAPTRAAAPATPSSAVRQALAGMEPEQREAIERMAAERMGGLDHLQGQDDYRRAVLTGWMVGRLSDARRLTPEASAADVLTSLLPVADTVEPSDLLPE